MQIIIQNKKKIIHILSSQGMLRNVEKSCICQIKTENYFSGDCKIPTFTRFQSFDEVLESFDGSVTPKIFMSSQLFLHSRHGYF